MLKERDIAVGTKNCYKYAYKFDKLNLQSIWFNALWLLLSTDLIYVVYLQCAKSLYLHFVTVLGFLI